VAGLVLGALAIAILSMSIQWIAGGDPTGYGGQRQGIYAREAFPAVDAPASGWAERVRKEGNASWLQAEAVKPWLDLRLLGWNLVYFLLGQNFGILPYFLPLLLGFLAYRGDRGRWAIPLAVGLAALAFLLLRPFNFTGGGALANRYFLPLYPALWFLAARPVRAAGAAWALVFAVLAFPFLEPLWKQPTAYPVAENGENRVVSGLARQWLPYETTQASVPGKQVSIGNGIWVKLLNHNAWASGNRGGLRVAGGSPVELLLGSPKPLPAIDVELDRNGPSRLLVGANEIRPVLLEPNGSVVFEFPLGKARAVHPLWWGPGDYYLYELDLRLPGARTLPIGMRLWPAENFVRTPWIK
jgi:hypothetical protein